MSYDGVFPLYRDHSPTQFDHNINIDDDEVQRSKWYVMPVSQTRDSGPLDQSNFKCFLDGLGGESETVEVHRFGHWGPGWYEIIIVSPDDETALKAAYEMAGALQDYPVLDEEDWSSREYEDYLESWDNWACRDFRSFLARQFGLTEQASYLLDDIDNDVLREFWGEHSSCEYESGNDGVYVRFDSDHIDRDDVAELLKAARRSKASA